MRHGLLLVGFLLWAGAAYSGARALEAPEERAPVDHVVQTPIDTRVPEEVTPSVLAEEALPESEPAADVALPRTASLPFAPGFITLERPEAAGGLRALAARAAPDLRCILELRGYASDSEGEGRSRFLADRRAFLAAQIATEAGLPERRIRVLPNEVVSQPYGEVSARLTGECP